MKKIIIIIIIIIIMGTKENKNSNNNNRKLRTKKTQSVITWATDSFVNEKIIKYYNMKSPLWVEEYNVIMLKKNEILLNNAKNDDEHLLLFSDIWAFSASTMQTAVISDAA
jgi:hypothetical protein